jgi:hypothetical protein
MNRERRLMYGNPAGDPNSINQFWRFSNGPVNAQPTNPAAVQTPPRTTTVAAATETPPLATVLSAAQVKRLLTMEGESLRQVLAAFGQPEQMDIAPNGMRTWRYQTVQGPLSVYFVNGKATLLR